jgi:hypothetical protein
VAAGALASLSCRSSSGYETERLALSKEAGAIEARHQLVDAQIASWSQAVGAWATKNNVTVDPARLVLSLASRSYFLHQPHPADMPNMDPEYAHLEDEMKDIHAKQRQIEVDWKSLLERDRASIERTGLKRVEHRQSFDFDVGDSTIPIPGVAARSKCCPLTTSVPGQTGCKLVEEFCVKPVTSGGKWTVWCMYTCDPKPVFTARKRASTGSLQH